MKVTIDKKIYYNKKKVWYSLNKNGKEYKVTGRKILLKLNKELELSKQELTLKTSGLGDLVEKVTKKLGIKKCAGCEERRKAFNRAFPWLSKSRDLTEEEQEYIIELRDRKSKQMDMNEQRKLFGIYNELTNSKLKSCICSGLTMRVIERLSAFIVISNDKTDDETK